MELYLTEEEARGSWHCYYQYISARGYFVHLPDPWQHPTVDTPGYPTRDEADEYAETLASFHRAVENISAANDEDSLTSSDGNWHDTPRPFPLTPTQWRTLRTAIEEQYAIYIRFPNTNVFLYRSLLQKLDTLTLAVHVAEAVENELTDIPAAVGGA